MPNLPVGTVEGAGFRHFTLKDVNLLGGGTKHRRIAAPNPQMKTVHKGLIAYLRQLPVNLSSATGARKGHSPLTNIIPHRHNRYFLLLDIKSAYETVEDDKLIEVLLANDPSIPRDLFGSEELEAFLKAHCLNENGGLLTGAPASPDLYNIYVGVLLDGQLRELATKYGLVYTRYLDDLTFSSNILIGKRKRKAIHTAIRAAGFIIHEAKTQLLDRRRGPVKITGLILNMDGMIILPRSYLAKIRGFLYLIIKERRVDQKTQMLANGMVAQLKMSLQYPAMRRPNQKRVRRRANKTEVNVLYLHQRYEELCHLAALKNS